MYAAYLCPHVIQLPEVAPNAPRQHQILSPLHQRAVLPPRGHDKCSKGIIDIGILSPSQNIGSPGSEVLPEFDRSEQPLPDGSLEARKREDSVGLLSRLSNCERSEAFIGYRG